MKCTFCGAYLRGMTDARLVVVESFTASGAVKGVKEAACVDISGCNLRVAALGGRDPAEAAAGARE